MKTIFSIIFISVFFLTGCSVRDLGIGYNKTYCEENGCDYSDAGICGDPFLIYKYKDKIDLYKYSYKGIKCVNSKEK